MANENTNNIIVGEDGSYYDGGYWGYIIRSIAVSLGTSATFGIAYPWLKCWFQKWLCSHTVISGKRMRFDGKGGDLFVKYIVWLILSYITCGIYVFWLDVRSKQWFSERTFFEGEPDNNSYFDGTVGDYFVTRILSYLATMVPFVGIAWSSIIMKRWWTQHTVVDSRRLTFDGTIGDLFLKELLWGLLTTVTCGIFAWFLPVKYLKWETEHTLDENKTPAAITAKANYKTQIHTDAVMLQSGDSAQLENIKAQMLKEANEGLAEQDIVKLENALRFADILNECDYEFNDEENTLIFDCTVLARKLKAIKPVSTKSKKWLIWVLAIVAGLVVLGGIILGGIVGAFILSESSFGGPGRLPGVMGGVTDTVDVNYATFYENLNYYAEKANFTVQEVASGVDGAVLEYKNSKGGIIEAALTKDDYGYIDEIVITVNRAKVTDDEAEAVVGGAYESLFLGDGYTLDTQSGSRSETHSDWTFDYEITNKNITVTIS